MQPALFVPSASLALLFAALPGSALADVLIVGPPGSGAEYAEIWAAVLDAEPGDQVRVRAGSYTPFTIDKPLQLVGEGRDLVFIAENNPFLPAIQILGIEAGGSVHVSGMTSASSIGQDNLAVRDCVGTVTLDDLRVGSKDGENSGVGGVSITNSTQVLITNSVVEVADNPDLGGELGFIGARAAVTVTDSTAVLEGCQVRGGDIGIDGFVLTYKDSWGGVGVSGLRSGIVLSDCLVEAGTGGKSMNASVTGRGGTAVELNGGTLIVTGDSELAGNSAPTGTGVPTAAGGPAIQAFGNAKLLVDPSNTLVAGFGFEPPIQAPTIELEGLAVQLPVFERFLTFHARNAPQPLGLGVELQMRAEPTLAVFPFVAIGASGPAAVPGLDGLALIDPAQAIPLAQQTVGASGVVDLLVTTGGDPSLVGQAAVFHGFQVDVVTGVAALGFGSATTLRP